LDDPESSALEAMANTQLTAHQREVTKPASGACGFARKNSDGCLEKKTSFFWINT
jgi:hypothetical protein